jgi:hypothetical protein
MEDTGNPAKRKTRERKTYKVSLNLDNPIENRIHSYIEQYGKGNASGNIKRILMGYISWDRIMSCRQPQKGEFPFREKSAYSGKGMDRPSSNDKKMAKKIFGY